MDFLTLFMTAIGLSMDAFAVSICNGLRIKNNRLAAALKTGAFFGAFQALMPAVGYFARYYLDRFINQYNHWISFLLLLFVGIRMIGEAYDKNHETCEKDPCKTSVLFVMAVATSIDALAVGVSLAVIKIDLVYSVLTIGIITFTLSFIGVMLGTKLGPIFKRRAEVAGGLVLCLIGLKILIEHLFFS